LQEVDLLDNWVSLALLQRVWIWLQKRKKRIKY